MATAHLIHGIVGSGKTTLARRLEQEHGAVRFTPDEWMAALFGADPSADIFQEKLAAVFSLSERLWTRCLRLEVDVVLDHGFWTRAERDRTRAVVFALGATPVLYEVSCSPEEARRRVAARNAGPERTLHIGPETFEVLLRRFEPLGADEDRRPP